MTGSPWKRRREGGETPKPTSIISRGVLGHSAHVETERIFDKTKARLAG
jgi:hypothetical protein